MLAVVTLGAVLTYLFWYVAVPVALAYLAGTLLAPDQTEAEEGPEGGQSRLWYPRTTQKEGGARPRAYGKNLHHGNIVEKFTQIDGNDHEILYLIVEHGDGPTKGVVAPLADNIFLNDQPASNFTAVAIQQRLGTMNQTVMTGFEKQRLEYTPKGVELKYEDRFDPYVWTSPNDFFDDIEYTLYWPEGLMKYHKDGGTTDWTCYWKVRCRALGGGWVTLFDSSLNLQTRAPFFKSYKVNTQVPGTVTRGNQYELEFTRTTFPEGTERRLDMILVRSIREVVDTAFTRPGKALVGIRAVATTQLSGGLDVKVIREDRIVNVWNGTTWTLQYSNNRADVAWDITTLPAIDGDGDGTPYEILRYDGIDPAYLDLEFFYKWRQFCAVEILDGYGGVEARSTCNTIIDEFTDIYSLVCKIGAVGRANIHWRGDKLTGWIDDEVTTPIDLVTMDSMMSKTWENAWAIKEELMGVAEVFYKDEKQGYERTSAEWANADAGGFRNIVAFEGIGIITRGEAIHYANHLLTRNQLLRNRNEFKVHKDGFRYDLGDVINLQCRIANWGAAFRVKSATADTITVDRDAIAEVTVGDVIHIRTYSAVLGRVVAERTYVVDTVAGRVITATENWDTLPIKGNSVAIGPAGAIKERRIIKMAPTTDNYFNVEVETYDAALFDADDLNPANPNANYIWPGPVSIITPPITHEELQDLFANQIPPQPNIEVPFVGNITWNDDTPGAGDISWSETTADEGITVSYHGTTYVITAASTDKEFIYYDPAVATTAFQTTDLITVATAAGRWYICRNISGTAYPASQMIGANIGVLLAGYLRVGTADIDDLSVSTIKIIDQAVTFMVAAYTAGQETHNNSIAWWEAQTITMDTTGAPVMLVFSVQWEGWADNGINVRIQRDDTTTIYQANMSILSVYGNPFCAVVVDEPDAGEHTYDLDLQSTDVVVGDPRLSFRHRSIVGQEVKK